MDAAQAVERTNLNAQHRYFSTRIVLGYRPPKPFPAPSTIVERVWEETAPYLQKRLRELDKARKCLDHSADQISDAATN